MPQSNRSEFYQQMGIYGNKFDSIPLGLKYPSKDPGEDNPPIYGVLMMGAQNSPYTYSLPSWTPSDTVDAVYNDYLTGLEFIDNLMEEIQKKSVRFDGLQKKYSSTRASIENADGLSMKADDPMIMVFRYGNNSKIKSFTISN